VTLTDLYPNTDAAARINAAGDAAQVRYHLSPVDAGRVPEALQGVRTMVCSFHHMPPPVARRILQDAFEKRQALCVLEVSDNSAPRWLWWTAIPVGVLMVLLLTLFIRPLRLRQVLLTYVLPVLSLLIAWDGAVSNARTYTEEDLRELLAGLEAPDGAGLPVGNCPLTGARRPRDDAQPRGAAAHHAGVPSGARRSAGGVEDLHDQGVSGRLVIVGAQEPVEAFPTDDWSRAVVVGRWQDELAVQALVVPLLVIVLQVLADRGA
jgi:hypothetical protein